MTPPRDIERLLGRVALGDRAAFSALYDATSAKLFGVCLQLLGDRTEAVDALQDVYVRIWQRADRYASGGYSPMTWLITVARKLAIDRLRAARPPAEPIEDVPGLSDGRPTPEAAAIRASERARRAWRLSRRGPLPGSGGALRRSAQHDADMAAPQPDQAEGLPEPMTDAHDTPGPQDGGDDAALAGEYALHLLDPEERRAFERRMAAEPRLRDLVREWDERLAVPADEIHPRRRHRG